MRMKDNYLNYLLFSDNTVILSESEDELQFYEDEAYLNSIKLH